MSKKLAPVLGRQMAKVCRLLGFCSSAVCHIKCVREPQQFSL
jgi:hypothetical protein